MLYTVVKGRGKPVLVLHGLLSDHTQVYSLLPALSGCKAIFPDLIGCGKSPAHTNMNIIDENLQQLKILCRRYKIQTVIAYSMSGVLACKLKLKNTIFISSYCSSPEQFGALRALAKKEPTVQLVIIKHRASILRLFRHYEPVPGASNASMQSALLYMLSSLSDYRKDAAKLSRVLVIHGREDLLISPKLGEEIATITGADALFVHEDHKSVLSNKTVRAAIKDFLTRN